MEAQPSPNSRLRQGSDIEDPFDYPKDARRAAVAQMMAENREGLGMKVIAVIVQRYGVLPRELWDLNSISDMGAERKIVYNQRLYNATFRIRSIVGSNRYSIVNLTIGRDVAHKVDLPGTLRQLTILAKEYDYSLDLPADLMELTFGWECKYNQPIIFPPGLLELEVGSAYTQPLTLPSSLKRLSFAISSRFNLPIDLPLSLRTILFGEGYDQLTSLPVGIEELRVGSAFTHDLSLPNSLRKIEWWCNHPIQIPEGVSEVAFRGLFNQEVVLPSTLKKATFGGYTYTCPLTFPAGMEELTWFHEYDGLVLPEGLQKLTWASSRSVTLPLGLTELVIGKPAPLVFPDGLRKLTLDCWSQHHYDLPESVREVTWFNPDVKLFTYPSTLQHLIVKHSRQGVSGLYLSRHKVHKMTIDCRHFTIIQWPRELKELEFTVEDIGCPLRVPEGCTVVGGKRPANIVMD